MAAAQGAAWVASQQLNRLARSCLDAQRRLEQNLAPRRELGAEVVMNMMKMWQKHWFGSRSNTMRPRSSWGNPASHAGSRCLSGGNLVDRVVRLSGSIDVYVVPAGTGCG